MDFVDVGGSTNNTKRAQVKQRETNINNADTLVIGRIICLTILKNLLFAYNFERVQKNIQ